MKLTAYLLAFGTEVPIPTREIEIPEHELEAGAEGTIAEVEKLIARVRDMLLDLAFKYGQNDFQPRKIRSVSVGDVIQLYDGTLHRVLGSGWEHLPAGTDINKLERGPAASLR